MFQGSMFQGSMVAIVTPMENDGSIAYTAFADLIEFQIQEGSDAIVPAGTTGESATLTFQEHCDVIRFTIEQVKGRVPVVAGTGANSTREALALTREAAAAGADACLLITPYYNKPPQEGLYRHYKTIATAVPIPQILYNVPGRTACDMLPETVARLRAVPEIIGIKEATGSLERSREIMRLCGDDFAVFSGEDIAAAEMILQGGAGVITVTGNVAPGKMRQMTAAALAGDRTTATHIDAQLCILHEKLFVESNPIPVKWALHRMGKIPGGLRLPLVPLSDSHHAEVARALQRAGVILT